MGVCLKLQNLQHHAYGPLLGGGGRFGEHDCIVEKSGSREPFLEHLLLLSPNSETPCQRTPLAFVFLFSRLSTDMNKRNRSTTREHPQTFPPELSLRSYHGKLARRWRFEARHAQKRVADRRRAVPERVASTLVLTTLDCEYIESTCAC